MQYKIAAQVRHEDMERTIEQMVSEGWSPQGGLSVVTKPITDYGHSGLMYFQAMVRPVPSAEVQEREMVRALTSLAKD